MSPKTLYNADDAGTIEYGRAQSLFSPLPVIHENDINNTFCIMANLNLHMANLNLHKDEVSPENEVSPKNDNVGNISPETTENDNVDDISPETTETTENGNTEMSYEFPIYEFSPKIDNVDDISPETTETTENGNTETTETTENGNTEYEFPITAEQGWYGADRLSITAIKLIMGDQAMRLVNEARLARQQQIKDKKKTGQTCSASTARPTSSGSTTEDYEITGANQFVEEDSS
ncbi:hypothetical protein DFH27DRAFT_521177 [Peziza echinospora]|nr:hypothetical protein DFH27DRAFT_521177 [Peziza echinospora]